MARRHTAEQMLAGALAVALEDGLSQLTFGRVAKHLDTSDRTVVYYFPTKTDLINGVLAAMGAQLQETLGRAFAEPAADHLALARAAWPVLASDQADPVFALFFEATGLAAADRAPYRDTVPLLISGWVDWSMQLLEGTEDHRRTEAEAAVALIDGLLLVRQLVGSEAAARAAVRLGIA